MKNMFEKMDLQLFAAGDPITITNSQIASFGAAKELTYMAADADTADLAQKFIYTPTGKDHKVVIGAVVANTHGTVALSFKGGAGVFGTATKAVNAVQNKTSIVQIETGRYMQADGTIEITATPASGKKLASEHALKIFVIELQ
jgi:hypothetical protein